MSVTIKPKITDPSMNRVGQEANEPTDIDNVNSDDVAKPAQPTGRGLLTSIKDNKIIVIVIVIVILIICIAAYVLYKREPTPDPKVGALNQQPGNQPQQPAAQQQQTQQTQQQVQQPTHQPTQQQPPQQPKATKDQLIRDLMAARASNSTSMTDTTETVPEEEEEPEPVEETQDESNMVKTTKEISQLMEDPEEPETEEQPTATDDEVSEQTPTTCTSITQKGVRCKHPAGPSGKCTVHAS